MSITDLPVFKALKTKMHWHQERQRVLAENVANADTPGYRGKDFKALEFNNTLKQTAVPQVHQAVTRPGHIQGGLHAGSNRAEKVGSFEITPEGNSVVLEEQMMKITANQMDYQAATSIYSRGVGMIKTALGKR